MAGDALATPDSAGPPLELAGRKPLGACISSGPLVGVEAPLFGPGVGLKAMGLMRALP